MNSESSPTRNALTNVCLSTLSLLVALAITEALLRVLPLPDLRVLSAFENPPLHTWADPNWDSPGPEAYQSNEVLGYEHAAGVDLIVPVAEHPRGAFRFRTNNFGLRRSSDTAVVKAPELFRVLVLGDSQTDGYVDNEESFSTILEIGLNDPQDAPGKRFEVLNAGVVGYSPAQEFLWYQLRGVELKPDLVLLVLYTGNDLVELRDPSKPTVDPASGRAIRAVEGKPPEGVVGPGRPADSRIFESSQLVALLRYTIRGGLLSEHWRELRLPGHVDEVGGFQRDALIQVLQTCHGCFWQSLRQAGYAHRDPQRIREDLQTTVDLLIRLDRDVQVNGGRLLVAILPTRAQVEPARARAELDFAARLLGAEKFDLLFENEVGPILQRQLDEEHVLSISLKEPLIAAALVEPLYYNRDWHLNVAGNRAVAAALEQAIRELAILPGPIPSEP